MKDIEAVAIEVKEEMKIETIQIKDSNPFT